MMKKILLPILFIFYFLATDSAWAGYKVIVNDGRDLLLVNGICSLREAIFWANRFQTRNRSSIGCQAIDDPTTAAGWATIEVNVENVVLNRGNDIVDRFGDELVGDLDISWGNLKIIGTLPDGRKPIINANHLSRVFDIHVGASNQVILNNLEITGGQHLLANGGGGILSQGAHLEIINSDIHDNISDQTQTGGGIATITSNIPGESLTITGSHIYNNLGCFGAGGIESTIPLTISAQSEIRDNLGSPGGGVTSTTTTLISDSTFSNNGSASDPAICPGGTGIRKGGALYTDHNNSVTISNSRFLNNTSEDSGGAIYSLSSNITIQSSLFDLNSTRGLGGGALYATNSIVNRVNTPSNITLNASTLSNNTVVANNGGGAIRNTGSQVSLNNSTLNNNTAGFGGAITNNTFLNTPARFTATLSTITENNATIAGGAIYTDSTSLVIISRSTIAFNFSQGARSSGGIHTPAGAAPAVSNVQLDSTLLINNYRGSRQPDGSITGGSSLSNCLNGNVESLGGNIIDNCLFTPSANPALPDRQGNVSLAALADNGGPTKTLALTGDNNPAVNGIVIGQCPHTNVENVINYTADQRGFCRPAGGWCDIGAFETPVASHDRGCSANFNNSPDLDSDGLENDLDSCPEAANRQADADNDGVDDVCDICAGNDKADADGDHIPDDCDADADNDGLANDAPDNCDLVPNPDQLDSDGDGGGDACDADVDGDGAEDAHDNCPLAANADQADIDHDGAGDICDAVNDLIPPAEHLCSDTLDNDNDGKTDCDDTDCAQDVLCLMAVNQANPQNQNAVEQNCADTLDDDADGKIDCDDSDCSADPACPANNTSSGNGGGGGGGCSLQRGNASANFLGM